MGRATIFFLLAAGLPVFGDFSYQQTSKTTGGTMAGVVKTPGSAQTAGEPMVDVVAVKGNRMLRATRHHATIIDLDKETITEIQLDKKTYSVVTFAQMNQIMEFLRPAKGTPDGQSFKTSSEDTGQKKQIAGFDAHEVVVTLEMDQPTGGMTITSNMWLAPKADGYDEVNDFHRRMIAKLNWAPGAAGSAGARPSMMNGLAALDQEAAKLEGMPVLKTVRMESPGGQGGLSKLVEMTVEYSNFSNAAVDDAKFAIPAGFRQMSSAFGRSRQ